MLAVILVLAYLILGLVLDLVGMGQVQTLIREAELWERAGMLGRARQRYLKAMAIFDSAWISARAARRTGPGLRAAAARFYLTAGINHSGFERAAVLHLLAHPGDETLALLWLGQDDTGELPQDSVAVCAHPSGRCPLCQPWDSAAADP